MASKRKETKPSPSKETSEAARLYPPLYELTFKHYLNQEQKMMNMGMRNISKEKIQMLIELSPKSWSNYENVVRWGHRFNSDCDLFIASYAKYLSDGLQVPNDGLDAGLLRKRYAALLWKYEESKAQKSYANDIKDLRWPKPNFIAPDEEQLVHIE
ncbi:hypothetical protein CQW23_02209 [Capsicum baccatum]|uniref:Uncharacterized protein n=1 Tax=Capsicum baccatum TaxID=33114 RepID=A0A2G2XQS3_CAPBA|nr:hypothetical protein CQW23_02209 [Capsicum baccatum]